MSSSPSVGAAVPALIGLLGVLATSAIGFLQWRRTQAVQRKIEGLKLEHDRERLKWEQERTRIEQRTARERLASQTELERRRRRAQDQETATLGAAPAAKRWSDDAVASEYATRLIAELRHLHILEMIRPLDLEHVYVQLRVREDSRGRFVRDDNSDPPELLRLPAGRVSTRTSVSSEVSGGERAADMAMAAVPPDEALLRFDRIAVLGDPGAGKTTMLRHMAFRIATGTYMAGARLPIYVELRRFVDSPAPSLLEFLAWHCEDRYGLTNAEQYLETQLTHGKAALLLDGLDEVLGGTTAEEAVANYDRVADEINRMAVRYPQVPIVVTCRRGAWRPALSSFQVLELLDFDANQMRAFVDNWFARDDTKAMQLRQALEESAGMRALAANPLVLSIIAMVFERELELPERRAELYNRCVDVLLREWDAHRGVRRYSQFTTDRKRDLLQDLAWHFHRAGRRYFPERELVEIISGFLPTIDVPRAEAQAILKEIETQYGLLREQARGWHGFMHLTFQEFFASVAAETCGDEGLREVLAHRHDPWWVEVILLLAGRMNDAAPLLCGILGRKLSAVDSGRNLAVHDDLFQSDLLLAARCLVGTPRIGPEKLRKRIVTEVMERLISSPTAFIRERLASVLIEINTGGGRDQLLTALSDRTVPNPIRVSVARAFGRGGDQTAASRLLTILTELIESSTARDREVLLAIISALGTMRARMAIPQMLHMLRAYTHTDDDASIRAELAEALIAIGDPAVVPVVREELTVALRSAKRHLGPLARLVVILGDIEARSWMLDVLLDRDPSIRPSPTMAQSGELRISIAKAFGEVFDDRLVDPIISAVANREVAWEVRWLLTHSLERYREEATTTKLWDLFSDQATDHTVRIAVATVLANWGLSECITTLRQAIVDRLIPPNLVLYDADGHHTMIGELWGPVCSALYRASDSRVVPVLVSFLSDSQYSQEELHLEGIGEAAVRFPSDDILTALLARARSSQTDAWSLGNAIGAEVTSQTAMEVIAFVGQRLRGLWPKSILVREDRVAAVAVRGVGRVAEDRAAAQALLDLSRHLGGSWPRTAEGCHEALFTVCQRGRLRPFPNGRLEPIAMSPGQPSDAWISVRSWLKRVR